MQTLANSLPGFAARSLANRLLVVVLLATALPTVIVGWLGYSSIYENIRMEKIRGVGFVAADRHAQLVLYLQNAKVRAAQFMDINLVRCAELFATVESDACLETALAIYVRREGATGAYLHRDPADQGVMVGFASELDWESLDLVPGQLAYLPPPEFNAERTYVIRSSDLVSHADLVMHYPVRLLETIFTPPHLLGASGETFLADAGGYFVIRVRYSSTQGTNAPITSAPMAACLARDDQETLGPDYRGVAVIHGFRHVPELGGACIMAIFDQEEAFAPLVTLRWYLAFVGTVVLLLAFVTATYVSRRTTGPILALHRAALQFIGGDRDAVADEIGHDEVTDLARSFNLLTRQVATTEKDLERRVERRTKELEEANAKLQTAVEERTAAEEKVREMAFYDSLTDLPNRRLLTERLSRAIVSCSCVRRHAALMFLDLDDFKSVNDTEGHKVGDKLLVKVAKRLRSCVRDTDTVARLGGDEFVILLENWDEARDDAAVEARMIAEKIVSALGESYELAGGSHRISVSMGIAMFDDPGTTVEAVFSRADAAMYEAKKGGKNGYRFATPVVQLPVGKAG